MADFIYNNNYILSNLDAQKLYAQSPLTTGVSGTSAYIGIEPSAQYNETVLYAYTGETKVSSGNLTEAATNFSLLRVSFREIFGSNNLMCGDLVGWIDMDMIDHNSKSGCSVLSLQDGNTTGTIGLRYGTFKLTSPTTFSGEQGYKAFTSTAASTTINNLWPIKVVGINRKENV